LTHARLIAIQNQWDLIRMHAQMDLQFAIMQHAELQEEIWGKERRMVLLITTEQHFLPYQSKNASSPL
jgi:hypothetical protein